MNTTLSGLIDQVKEETKIDPKGTVNSDNLIARNLNRALLKIQQEMSFGLPQNQAVFVLNIQVGQREYDLPDDFTKIAEPQSVKIGASTPLYPVDYNTLLGSFDLDDSNGLPNVYYIRQDGNKWVIGLYPTSNTSDTVTIPYNKRLADISSTQSSPLPTEYDEALVLYASYLTLRRIKGYQDLAGFMFQSYKEAMLTLISNAMTFNRHALRYGTQRRGRGVNVNPKAISGNLYNY
jgi:hypothetical protein